MSYAFLLTDVPGYLARFPVLKGRPKLGRGQFSIVYEGTRPDTVLKFTCDPVYIDFMRHKSGAVGLPSLVAEYGSMPSKEHGEVYLVEVSRLLPLHRWDHSNLILERNAIANAVEFQVAMNEQYCGMAPCQQIHALALLEVRKSGLFSGAAESALKAISEYLDETEHDVLLDLLNPDNYMTDGTRLIITDPVMPVF